MRYAKKVKDDPTKSPMYELDLQRETHLELNLEEHPFGAWQEARCTRVLYRYWTSRIRYAEARLVLCGNLRIVPRSRYRSGYLRQDDAPMSLATRLHRVWEIWR